MTYLFVSEKNWHKQLFERLSSSLEGEWLLISDRASFTAAKLKELNPAKIFIPHWSYLIPEEIFAAYECIVFHMTDLPFGRGGSPLQNLVVRGFEKTMLSAIRVEKGLDAGDVYLKKELLLLGTAEEIFLRSTLVIEEMIAEIIRYNLKPLPQNGEPVVFARRKPAEGNLAPLDSLEKIFDYIRMLDAEGYPKAFLEVGNFRFEFSRASLKSDNSIIADVRISKK